MAIQTVDDLLAQGLAEICNAEKQLFKILPKLIKASKDKTLARSFETHMIETEGQIVRLKQVAELFDLKPRRKKLAVIDMLVGEAVAVTESMECGVLRDVAIIFATQKIKHYEIAVYSHLMRLTKHLGNKKASKLLREALLEEEDADERLSDICEREWLKLSRKVSQ